MGIRIKQEIIRIRLGRNLVINKIQKNKILNNSNNKMKYKGHQIMILIVKTFIDYMVFHLEGNCKQFMQIKIHHKINNNKELHKLQLKL